MSQKEKNDIKDMLLEIQSKFDLYPDYSGIIIRHSDNTIPFELQGWHGNRSKKSREISLDELADILIPKETIEDGLNKIDSLLRAASVEGGRITSSPKNEREKEEILERMSLLMGNAIDQIRAIKQSINQNE